MTEYEIIRRIAARFPRSSRQLNKPFECDAELVEIGGQVWGLTMDDFSPSEDLFTSDQPEALGSNLAVATLSDLLAAGIEPCFFMHALSIPANAPSSFIDGVTDGIEAVLNVANCALCGGDLGTADPWRYCGFAMGPAKKNRPLTHKLPAIPQRLWVTGTLGDANLAALLNKSTPTFELRLHEALAIREHATGCIDTSGGLLDAIWILHELNPAIRFEINSERIPFSDGIAESSRKTGFPPEATLAGGAGEYELLFTTPTNAFSLAGDELGDLKITPIADLHVEGNPGVFIKRHGKITATMTCPPPSPRAARTVQDHVKAVVRYAAAMFGDLKHP